MTLTSAEMWKGTATFSQCRVAVTIPALHLRKVYAARLRFGWLRLHGYSQRIFLLVVTKAAPRRGILRKAIVPLIGRRKRVQAICARGQRVAFDGNVIAEPDRSVLICPPHAIPCRTELLRRISSAHLASGR